MKCNLRRQSKYYLLIVLSVAADGLRMRASMWTARHIEDVNDNPQDFFIRGTASTPSFSFRYDPRAADEWLFRSGVRLIGTATLSKPITSATN
jgi:hypothetical protein